MCIIFSLIVYPESIFVLMAVPNDAPISIGAIFGAKKLRRKQRKGPILPLRQFWRPLKHPEII
jgi:hypothetical protein